MEIRRAI